MNITGSDYKGDNHETTSLTWRSPDDVLQVTVSEWSQHLGREIVPTVTVFADDAPGTVAAFILTGGAAISIGRVTVHMSKDSFHKLEAAIRAEVLDEAITKGEHLEGDGLEDPFRHLGEVPAEGEAF